MSGNESSLLLHHGIVDKHRNYSMYCNVKHKIWKCSVDIHHLLLSVLVGQEFLEHETELLVVFERLAKVIVGIPFLAKVDQ